MSRLVFVPTSREQAEALRERGEAGPWLAFLASSGLQAQLSELTAEELEYVALNHAGVARLVDPAGTADLRLVVAAEVAEEDLLDLDIAEVGAATVSRLAWSQVVALFADEPEARAAVAAAREAVRGRSVTEALAAPPVTALLEAHDLGWYAPTELDQLP